MEDVVSRAAETPVNARSLLWKPSDSVRDANRRRVIRAVMAGPGTQVGIAKQTGLSQATVSGIIADLQREGVVRADSTEGERGKRIRLGPIRGVAVGVEVNHNGLSVAVRRLDTTATQYESIEFAADQGGTLWVRESVRIVKDLVAESGLDESHILSIGLGVPAAVDPRPARVTQVAASLSWDLSGEPGTRFRDHFPHVPVIVDNEANLAAWGEATYGAGRGHETVLFIKASTGVGSGLVIAGVIYRGRHGLAGEIGHLTMDPLGTVCRCGNRGCLETIVGGARLIDQVRQAYAGYRMDLPGSLESMIERAKNGDVVCRRILQDAARNIGLALARVCNLVNPEVVVLGGELGRAADLLIEPMVSATRLYALHGMFESTVQPMTIVGGELGLQAGARGALEFAVLADRTVQGVS